MRRPRADRQGAHRVAFENNRKRLLATSDVCAICGQPIDKSIKAPHPLSACVDHIVPISKGGHPSSLDNLQLVHRACNRKKSDKLIADGPRHSNLSMRNLPQFLDWTKYKG